MMTAARTWRTSNRKLLISLSAIESNNRDKKIGSYGEVSRWQIKPATWRRHSKIPLNHAVNPLVAQDVAAAIMLDNEERFFKKKGVMPSAAQRYAMYNMGFTGFSRVGFLMSKCSAAVQERAERYANLVTSEN